MTKFSNLLISVSWEHKYNISREQFCDWKQLQKRRSGHYFPLCPYCRSPPGPLSDRYQQWHQAAPATNRSSVQSDSDLRSCPLNQRSVSPYTLSPMTQHAPLTQMTNKPPFSPSASVYQFLVFQESRKDLLKRTLLTYWQFIKLKHFAYEYDPI